MIVFQRTNSSGDTIWKMTFRGEGQASLGAGKNPDWSPDGRKIVFTAGGPSNDQGIFLANDDGTARVRINIPRVNDGPGVESFQTPVFSPDGTKIAYVRDKANKFDIFVVDINGSGQRRLTANAGKNILPAWSPDGQKLLFASDRDSGGRMNIFSMATDGSGVQQVTRRNSMTTTPCWSPDGTRIAFSSVEAGNTDVFVMDLATENVRNITRSPGIDSRPNWAPNGRTILVDRNEEGRRERFISTGTVTNIIAIPL